MISSFFHTLFAETALPVIVTILIAAFRLRMRRAGESRERGRTADAFVCLNGPSARE
jgi:hypothetical protein